MRPGGQSAGRGHRCLGGRGGRGTSRRADAASADRSSTHPPAALLTRNTSLPWPGRHAAVAGTAGPAAGIPERGKTVGTCGISWRSTQRARSAASARSRRSHPVSLRLATRPYGTRPWPGDLLQRPGTQQALAYRERLTRMQQQPHSVMSLPARCPFTRRFRDPEPGPARPPPIRPPMAQLLTSACRSGTRPVSWRAWSEVAPGLRRQREVWRAWATTWW